VEGQVRLEADLDMNEHAARPPVPLPDVDGVSFLATVGEIVAECAQMGHCIATCARSAVAGDCDLFHVEHRSEQATVEVSRTGRVREATGPKNRRNRAATWGRAILTRWASTLQSTAGPDHLEDRAGSAGVSARCRGSQPAQGVSSV
jgi:hypothetical protein